MKDILYKKVEIKNKQNLPKELKGKNITDFYFIGTDLLEMVGYYDFEMGAWYGQNDEQLYNPDWYLQPIEPQEIDINTPFFGNTGAKIPIKETHDTCDGCQMFGDNGCNLDVSICPDCAEHHMWTAQVQPDEEKQGEKKTVGENYFAEDLIAEEWLLDRFYDPKAMYPHDLVVKIMIQYAQSQPNINVSDSDIKNQAHNMYFAFSSKRSREIYKDIFYAGAKWLRDKLQSKQVK